MAEVFCQGVVSFVFRFNSKQVFECFFFPFALLQNYAYSQVEQCVRFVVGDKKQIKPYRC